MKMLSIKNRSILVTYQVDDWNLNLHLIKGKQSNYLIDTGLGCLSIAPLVELIKSDTKPLIIINTHYHWDHIWGNFNSQSSMIIAHVLCRSRIQDKWDDMLNKHHHLSMGEVKKILPNMVFEKELYFPEDKIRLIHTPGHTMDSISVLDEEDRVLNAADNIGDTIEEIVPSLECSIATYKETLQLYKTLDFAVCVSGHNAVQGPEVFDQIFHQIST